MPTATKIEDNKPSAQGLKAVGQVQENHIKAPTRSRLALLPPSQSYLQVKRFGGLSSTKLHNGLTVPQHLAPQTCQRLRAGIPTPAAMNPTRQIGRVRLSLLLRPRSLATPHHADAHSVLGQPGSHSSVAGPVEVLGSLQQRTLPSSPMSCRPEPNAHSRKSRRLASILGTCIGGRLKPGST